MSSKYEAAKNVALSGRRELSELLKVLDILWIQGDLTDEQHDELVQLARDHADPALSHDLTRQLEALEARVTKLEEAAKQPNVSPDPAPDADPEWPEYKKDHPYRTGDKVTHQGKHYICNLPEYVDTCYWSPSAYPAYWHLVA